MEVETPVMIAAPAPEEFIDAPSAAADKFLRASPELEMKRMLAAGYEKIYQIGPCFRAGEHGRRHRTEFTMLEWYEVGADYNDLMKFTAEMLAFVAERLCQSSVIEYCGCKIDFSRTPEILSVDDAYCRFSDTSAAEALKSDRFDEIMVTDIEPRLGLDRPAFLKDYPADRAALARLSTDGLHAERWELYLAGIEIANAYTELIDAAEQRCRFEQARFERKANGLKDYPEAALFMEAIEAGIPAAAGCALGVDRLAMIFTGAEDIAEVRFPAFE
jgi:lysyl-tRNA synthetase class 2